MEDDRPRRVYSFPNEFLTYANTLTSSPSLFTPLALANTQHEYKTAEILRQHTQTGTIAEMAVITVHLLSIPTQSEVIQKGLIRADELPSRVPFFLLLLIAAISVCVGARCRLITLLSQMSPSSPCYAGRGDVPGRCQRKTPSRYIENIIVVSLLIDLFYQ